MPRIWKPTGGNPYTGTYSGVRQAGARKRREELDMVRATQRAEQQYIARGGYTTVPRTRGVYAKGENKIFDAGKALTAVVASADWTGTEEDPTTLNCLFVPTQGSQINQRIGRKVTLRKIKVKGFLNVAAQSAQSAGDTSALTRIVLYQDKQTNASFAQGENVFGELAGVNPQAIDWFQNPDNFGRFNVLKDKTFRFGNPNIANNTGAAGGIIQQGMSLPFKFNLNFPKGIEINFNATNGGSVADIVDNSFHILAICINVDMAPNITYACRCTYTG